MTRGQLGFPTGKFKCSVRLRLLTGEEEGGRLLTVVSPSRYLRISEKKKRKKNLKYRANAIGRILFENLLKRLLLVGVGEGSTS